MFSPHTVYEACKNKDFNLNIIVTSYKDRIESIT